MAGSIAIDSEYEVAVLKAGYSEFISAKQERADCTITLVTGPATKLLIDTGGPSNRDRLPQLLKRFGLAPSDIDYVVCTHGHADHVSNIGLFDKSAIILAGQVTEGDQHRAHDFRNGPYRIDDHVQVIATPGHSSDGLSVIVRTRKGTYAIVGDLFESQDDFSNEDRWKARSASTEIQDGSRGLIRRLADFIIPGHGDVFAVDQNGGGGTDWQVDTATPRKSLWVRVLEIAVVPLVVSVVGGVVLYFLFGR